MTSPGELRPVRDGGVAVLVDPDQIAASMRRRRPLPLGRIIPTVDGAEAFVLLQYSIVAGTHIVFALQEERLRHATDGRLFFAGYILVDGVWKQTGVVEDPLGNIKQEVVHGGYNINTIHRYYLRCCD